MWNTHKTLCSVSPKLKGGYTAGGNLPLGDLMGKEEPAQGSSNGLRTIHDYT